MPCSLVVKKGSKMWALRLVRHPRSGVGDLEHRVPSRRQSELGGPEYVEIDDGRLDPDLATVRHRIARVDDEVHEHLLELAGVRAHGLERRRRVDHERDVLVDQAVQHRLDASHELVEIDLLV